MFLNIKEKRKIILIIKYIILPLKKAVNKLLEILNIFIIWRSGKAIGDQVLMAGLAKIIYKKYNSNIIVITNYPKLLSLSPWIKACFHPNKIIFWKFFYYFLKLFEGKRTIEYNFPYRAFGYKSHLEAYRSGFYKDINEPPIWQAHVADRFDKNFFKNFSGGLIASKDKQAYLLVSKIRFNYPNKKLGIINPVGKGSYTKSKVYGFKNYQEIINNSYNKINWIQVGKNDDPILKKIFLDLRGNSLTFLVDIISLSDLVLSDEGLLNHIAGSFPKVNSYVTYSEFSPANYYSYKNTITLGKKESFSEIKYWGDIPRKQSITKKPIDLAKIILENEFN